MAAFALDYESVSRFTIGRRFEKLPQYLYELLLSVERKKRLDSYFQLLFTARHCSLQLLDIPRIDKLRVCGHLNEWVVEVRLETVRFKEAHKALMPLLVIVHVNDKVRIDVVSANIRGVGYL